MNLSRRLGARVRVLDPVSVALVVLPVLPVLSALARLLVAHRVPLGDNGLIALRSADVLTANHPWYGTWTSASLSAGIDFNNPSPLQFDLLALFVKPFGVSAGALMGAAFINIAAIAIAVRQGCRAAARRGEVLFALAAAGLAWSLGSEMLVDVWQPHNLVLPFLAFLACCTALAAGRWSSMGWAVGVGSVVVGSHVSFVYVTVLVLVASTGWAIGTTRHHERVGAARGAKWAGVVGLACWSQSLVEQFFLPGRGNLSRMLAASGTTDEPIGLRLGARLVAQVVALPPWWLRPSFTDSIRFTPYAEDGSLRPGGVVRPWVAAVALLSMFVLLAVLLRRAWRRGDRGAAGALLVGLAGSVGVLATLVVMPAGVIGLAPHQMRWLWPVSAVVTLWVAAEVARGLPLRDRAPRDLAAVGLATVVVLSVINLPNHESDLGPSVTRASNDAIRELMREVAVSGLPGPTVFDGSTLAFAEPYSGAVLAALVKSGAPIRAATDSFTHQLGNGRRPRGDERWSVQIRDGAAADELGAGESLLASATTPLGGVVAVVLIDRSAS